MNLFWRGLEFVIGAIFIFAGIVKVLDPLQFANDIDNFHMLPWALSVRLAFYLPWLEIMCGLALILRRFYTGSLAILAALALVFIGALVSARVRGLDIKCGCFGRAIDNIGFASHLLMNLAIVAAIALILRRVNLLRDRR
jgi:putative oxidoreductase